VSSGRSSLRAGARTQALRHAVILSILTFGVHFVWESVQCPIFFVHGSYDATWRGMVRATLGDVALTWMIYTAVALVPGAWRWDRRPWRGRAVVTMQIAAVVLAVFVEMRGLREGRWAYTPITPVLPVLGVSLVPVVQLMVLTPLVVWVAERIAPAPPPERIAPARTPEGVR